jgi:hypothetical protein
VCNRHFSSLLSRLCQEPALERPEERGVDGRLSSMLRVSASVSVSTPFFLGPVLMRDHVPGENILLF